MQVTIATLEPTDWRFEDEATMLDYLRNLMSLLIEPAELKPLVQRWLRPTGGADHGAFVLPWSLGYHVLRKVA
jgi:hypothetical protein